MTETKSAKPMNGDPRPKTRAEERAEAITTPSRSELLEQLTEAEQALARTREQADDNLRNWQRTAADFVDARHILESAVPTGAFHREQALETTVLRAAAPARRSWLPLPAPSGWSFGHCRQRRPVRYSCVPCCFSRMRAAFPRSARR